MKASWLAFVASAAIIIGLTVATLLPYGGHPSALLHYGADQAARELPNGFVVLNVPSYDGALYFRIATQLPLLLSADGRDMLSTMEPKSYAYQRILLPAVASILALGRASAIPWALLFINLAAAIATGAVVARGTQNPLAILALVLSPAMLLGLHFSLAEPLTILLLTAFLIRARERAPLHTLDTRAQEWALLQPFDVMLLSLAVLTREINILFVLGTAAWLLLGRRWKDATWTLVPIAVFAVWHSVIFSIFEQWPFFLSADKRGLPLRAVWEIVSGQNGYTAYTLSSIALLLLFVLPVLCWSLWQVVRRREYALPLLGTLAFALLMLCMPDHIWGSITSIGRVITPVYPCAILALAARDTWPTRTMLSATMLLGLAVGLSLALNTHSFHFA